MLSHTLLRGKARSVAAGRISLAGNNGGKQIIVRAARNWPPRH